MCFTLLRFVAAPGDALRVHDVSMALHPWHLTVAKPIFSTFNSFATCAFQIGKSSNVFETKLFDRLAFGALGARYARNGFVVHGHDRMCWRRPPVL